MVKSIFVLLGLLFAGFQQTQASTLCGSAVKRAISELGNKASIETLQLIEQIEEVGPKARLAKINFVVTTSPETMTELRDKIPFPTSKIDSGSFLIQMTPGSMEQFVKTLSQESALVKSVEGEKIVRLRKRNESGTSLELLSLVISLDPQYIMSFADLQNGKISRINLLIHLKGSSSIKELAQGLTGMGLPLSSLGIDFSMVDSNIQSFHYEFGKNELPFALEALRAYPVSEAIVLKPVRP